jgi:hypothetical protein
MQEAREVHNKSVGEKASPLPWLSTGASVINVLPDFRCSALLRRFPWYEMVIPGFMMWINFVSKLKQVWMSSVESMLHLTLE